MRDCVVLSTRFVGNQYGRWFVVWMQETKNGRRVGKPFRVMVAP